MFTQLDTAHILDVKNKLKDALHQKASDLQLPLSSASFSYITGGAIASYLQGEAPKDIDIYFRNEMGAKLVKEYFQGKGNDHVAEINEKYREATDSGKLITENAITLKNGLQFITGHTGEPGVLRTTFDFLHCLPYFDPSEDKLYISYNQFRACVDKKLIVNNHKFVTQKRKHKFFERGYTLGG